MKVDAPIRIGPWESVFQVAFDMQFNLPELYPYLVMPPGVKVDFKLMVPVRTGKVFIRQACQFPSRNRIIMSITPVFFFILDDVMNECFLRFGWHPVHHSPIRFFYSVFFLELVIEPW